MLEIYILNILPALGEWAYARQFLGYETFTLDTSLSSSSPATPNQPLTPISPSQRDSSNSSDNSTDSHNEDVPATLPDRTPLSVLVSPSPDASFDAKPRSRSMSDKQRLLSCERHSPPATTTATVPSSYLPGPPSSGQRPRPSRSMSATASRLIRRVASAPNAKGLFNLGSRQSSTATKNGLLALGAMTLCHPALRPPALSCSGAMHIALPASATARRRYTRTDEIHQTPQ